ncbi:hypothetical protein N0V90_010555 [Kalmusia sp. IMI 367209]|nr:hypothetical protein N0V90_010555 [Kalmusia sp. IMI 367209]
MIAFQLLFAASSIIGLSRAAPAASFPRNARSLAAQAPEYKIFGGDGTVEQGWPAKSSWIDYESMWEANYEVMMNKIDETGCLKEWGPNTEAEVAVIKSGIEAAASASGLDHRFILAVMMQESNGCVRIPTSYSPTEGTRNPGLFQDANGDHTCNDEDKGVGLSTPCPDAQIKGMINDGVTGTASGGGLQQTVEEAGVGDDSRYYKGARIYNSGMIDDSGNLGKGRATHCYSSDIANRLIGWTGIGRTCDPDTIGDVEGTPTVVENPGERSETTSVVTPAPIPSEKPAPTATPSPAEPAKSTPPTETTPVAAPPPTITGSYPTSTVSVGDGEPIGMKFAGAPADCSQWYSVQPEDGCRSIEIANGVAIGTIKKLNKGVNSRCGNLYNNVNYCLAIA